MRVETRESLAKLEPRTIAYALNAGYLHKPSGRFLWYTDGMQFMNHGYGRQANVGLDYWPKLKDDHIISFRDIQPGEELREDYGACLAAGLAPGHWLRHFYLSYCPRHYDFLLRLRDTGDLFCAAAGAGAEAVGGGGTNSRTAAISASSKIGFERTARNPEAKHAA